MDWETWRRAVALDDATLWDVYVRSEVELARLQGFLTGIARLLDKTVLVTPENGQDYPWFEIAPNGSARSGVA